MLSQKQKDYIRKARQVGMRITDIVSVMKLTYSEVNNEVQKLARVDGDVQTLEQRERYSEYQSAQKIKRDDRTLAVYRALRCDVGQTATDIAESTGYCRETVGRDLAYLSIGHLAVLREGKWYRPESSYGSCRDEDDKPPELVKILGATNGKRKRATDWQGG